MGRGLIFVRHAMSAVDPEIPSRQWGLTESAREDCVILAHALPEQLASTVFTSSEAKARETGAIIALRRGLKAEGHTGFGEVERPWGGPDNSAYRETAASYINGQAVPGWEQREHVLFRFNAAIDHALQTTGDGDIVIATHGMSPTIYLASQLEFDAVAFWRALTFPDAWRFDAANNELTHLFQGGLSPE